MIDEYERPSGAHTHMFSMKPGGELTMSMISENILITNARTSTMLRLNKYSFNLPSLTNTKIFGDNCEMHTNSKKIHQLDYFKLAIPLE